MMKRFFPREEKFFDLFASAAEIIVDAAKEFRELLKNMEHIEERVQRIKDLEHKGDELTHVTVELLHKTFITPLDREDIFQLIGRLDDVLDFIDAAAQRINFYGVTQSRPEASALADITLKSVQNLKEIILHLPDLSNRENIVKHCIEINRLENEADHVLRSAVGKLFRDEPDVRELIKWKELFELMESVSDRCEDVANIVEGIVMEYA